MKKLLLFLSFASVLTSLTTFAADPLVDFPTSWQEGTYTVQGCGVSIPADQAKVLLTTTNEQHSGDDTWGYVVTFGGTLTLENWPASSAYPLFENTMNLNPQSSSVKSLPNSNDTAFSTVLYMDANHQFVSSPFGYNKDTKQLNAQFDYGGSCRIQILVSGAGQT